MNELQADIKDLIFEYRHALGNILKEKLHGLYIYNSAAMGKFEPSYSDIDFVTVIKSPLTDWELDSLEKLHKKLCLNHKYGSKLDGMYLQYSDLGKSNNEIKPYPYIEDMNFCKEGYFDINNITWWSL